MAWASTSIFHICHLVCFVFDISIQSLKLVFRSWIYQYNNTWYECAGLCLTFCLLNAGHHWPYIKCQKIVSKINTFWFDWTFTDILNYKLCNHLTAIFIICLNYKYMFQTSFFFAHCVKHFNRKDEVNKVVSKLFWTFGLRLERTLRESLGNVFY